MKGKIILFLVFVIVALVVYTTFFSSSFETGVAELRELEQKTNAQEAFFVPISQQELSVYKRELLKLKSKYSSQEALKNVFDIKADLSVIEGNVLQMVEDFELANKLSPDCSSNSKLGNVTRLSDETLDKIDLVLAKRNSFAKKFPKEAMGVKEISSANFEQALSGVKSGVEQIQVIVSYYC